MKYFSAAKHEHRLTCTYRDPPAKKKPCSDIAIEVYEINRNDRKDRNRRGCAVYHKSSIEVVEIEKYKTEDIEALWIQVELSPQKMLFGTEYRPPQQESFYDKFETTMLEQIRQERRNIFTTGDLNSDMTPDKMNDKGRRLGRLLNSFNLKNIKEVRRVTENTKTVLEFIIVNGITKVKASGVHDICIADYKLIYLKLLLQRKKSKPKVATVTDYRKLDLTAYKNEVEAAPRWICSIFDDVGDIPQCWKSMYNEIRDSHKKRRKNKNQN